jgi:hypothetical protein
MTKPDLLPPEPDGLELLHTRTYVVKVWKVADDEMLVRGAVHDLKPPGLYVSDDPDPITMHHMILELRVRYPDLVITSAELVFEDHPHRECPEIAPRYRNLVGLSIARGFTHKVRELFGGPRGCTHSTALLQAMGPAVVQSTWSMRVKANDAQPVALRRPPTQEERERMFMVNLNTCHIWAEDGEHMATVRRGEQPEPPLQVVKRLQELGRDPSEWRMSG